MDITANHGDFTLWELKFSVRKCIAHIIGHKPTVGNAGVIIGLAIQQNKLLHIFQIVKDMGWVQNCIFFR